MPYQVTPLDGIRQRLGAGARVTGSEGVDRIALREVTTGRYLTATGTTDADPVRRHGDRHADAGGAVRRRSTGARAWSPCATWPTASTSATTGARSSPGTTSPTAGSCSSSSRWRSRPTATYLIRYVGYETRESWFGPNRYVTVGADGTLALGAATADDAARFAQEVVSERRSPRRSPRSTGADAAVVVVGSMPFINGRETDDRTTTRARARARRRWSRRCARANPNTVVVLENSYPTTITWEQRHVPAILWTTHAGAGDRHTRSPTCSSATTTRAGGSPRPGTAPTPTLPDILDYDIVKTGMTYLYHRGTPLYPFGHGLSYTWFRTRTCA